MERAGIKGADRSLPFAIGTALDSVPLATPLWIPQGGSLPTWITDFNP